VRISPTRSAVLLVTAAALPLGLAGPGSASHDGDTRRCFGAPATIEGTAGDDVIRGTERHDVIVGMGGDDEIYGLGGIDFLCGGSGNDLSFGGDRFDLMAGGDGDDESDGGGGPDYLIEDHDPFSIGDPGFDEGADSYSGGPGDDLVADDGGSDSLDGGPGNDTFFGLFSLDPVVIDLPHGTAVTFAERNVLSGFENALGSMAPDVIVGTDAPNLLSGVFGPDVVLGAGGPDLIMSEVDGGVLVGGDGGPDAVFAIVSQVVEADLGAGTLGGPGGQDRLVGIEDFIGTWDADTIAGSGEANRLYGNGGDDVLTGDAGDDVIRGDWPLEPWIDVGEWKVPFRARGEDVLVGGDGTDELDGGPRRDMCTSGERLRGCESGSDAPEGRPEEPEWAWRPPAPLRSWLLSMIAADSRAEVRPPVWTPDGLR
jgi:Ca2+-binding RTX toxin-like protein